jgi:hypothetical protein
VDDEGSVIPVVPPDSVELHLDDEGEVVIGAGVEGLLNLPSLHEEVAWKIFVVGFGGGAECFGEDVLAVEVVVEEVEEPATVVLQHSIGRADSVGHVRVPVLDIGLYCL